MSRIGKAPVELPKSVKVSFKDSVLTVEGPKGKLSHKVHSNVGTEITSEAIVFTRSSDEGFHKAIHGTTRAIVKNMVSGVTEGFIKGMNIVGVGYRAEQKGADINLLLGYSHPVIYKAPAGITLKVETANRIVVSGIDRQKVGQVAAEIQEFRPPEPYKGKGIILDGQVIRRKQGKKTGK